MSSSQDLVYRLHVDLRRQASALCRPRGRCLPRAVGRPSALRRPTGRGPSAQLAA